MNECTKCGVREICAWIFRGREYCLDCYKFRKEQAQDASNYILKEKYQNIINENTKT